MGHLVNSRRQLILLNSSQSFNIFLKTLYLIDPIKNWKNLPEKIEDQLRFEFAASFFENQTGNEFKFHFVALYNFRQVYFPEDSEPKMIGLFNIKMGIEIKKLLLFNRYGPYINVYSIDARTNYG